MAVENSLKTPVVISNVSVEPSEQGGFFGSAVVIGPNRKPGIVTALEQTRKKTIKELLISVKDLQKMG